MCGSQMPPRLLESPFFVVFMVVVSVMNFGPRRRRAIKRPFHELAVWPDVLAPVDREVDYQVDLLGRTVAEDVSEYV